MTTLALIPVCLTLAVPLPLYPFLLLVFIYLFLFSVSMVYYNHLRLEFASEEQTSLDLAAFTTLSNVFKPIAVLASGLLAESLGSSWAYYFAALLTLFSALTCLWLPRSAAQPSALLGSYETGSIIIK
jgi:predicted MFS family arabinose efflux permease